MAKRQIKAGSIDQTIDLFIQDSSSTAGAGLTGLAFNTSGLTCYYRKGATGTPTALTLATQTVGGAHSDGGFVAVDGTNCPGQYRLDLSDTIVASAGMVTLYLKGATNMAPVLAEIEVVSFDPFDGVRLGLTALPNAAAQASGGLYTRGTGAGQINQDANGRIDVNLVSSLGVAVVNEDFTMASATSTTVTLPTTYSSGASLPDDDRYEFCALYVTPGTTGGGQMVRLTTAAAGARQYNVDAGSMPVQLDSTSKCQVYVPWVSNLTRWKGTAPGDLVGSRVDVSIGAAQAGFTPTDTADSVLTRNASNVEASAGEHTLCTVILAMLENSISGTTLTIKRTNGSTTHYTKTLTTTPAGSADVITGIQ